MVLTEPTKLQKAFLNSHVIKLIENHINIIFDGLYSDSKRLLHELTTEYVFKTWSEPQLKIFLYELLLCIDIDKDTSNEIKWLLSLSETQLTRHQIEKFNNRLYE